MPRSHAPYPEEFRRQIVALVRAGRTPEELAEEFEPSANAIRNWLRQAEIDEGSRQDGLTTDEMWLLPTPVGPTISALRCRRTNSQVARSYSCCRLTVGLKSKSNDSSVFVELS